MATPDIHPDTAIAGKLNSLLCLIINLDLMVAKSQENLNSNYSILASALINDDAAKCANVTGSTEGTIVKEYDLNKRY